MRKGKELLGITCAMVLLCGCQATTLEETETGVLTGDAQTIETAAQEEAGAQESDAAASAEASGSLDAAESGDTTDAAETVDAEEPVDSANEVATTDADATDAAEGAITAVYAQIASEISLVSPMLAEEDFIYNYYGIDTAMLDEYVFEISEDATSAETIVIMKVAEEGNIATIQASLEMLLQDKAAEMQDYLPQQYDLVMEAKVQVKGPYLWLVISESQAEIEEMIEEAL